MKRYEITKKWRHDWAGESQYADPIVDSAVETMKKLERQIERLQRDNAAMTSAMVKIHERMKGPASNQRFMQIAGPARECLNLAKPFLPNA
jgi:hypothetical protein